MMIARLLLAVTVSLFSLNACSGPITSGARSELSSPSDRLLVWGNHPAAVNTAVTWLQNRGIDAVDSTKLREGRQDQRAVAEAELLKTAGDLGVQQVVFVTYSGDIRAPMVYVRALNADKGQIRWSGTARYPEYGGRPLNHALSVLTCYALSTAWGYREPGIHRFSSENSACEVDK